MDAHTRTYVWLPINENRVVSKNRVQTIDIYDRERMEMKTNYHDLDLTQM